MATYETPQPHVLSREEVYRGDLMEELQTRSAAIGSIYRAITAAESFPERTIEQRLLEDIPDRISLAEISPEKRFALEMKRDEYYERFRSDFIADRVDGLTQDEAEVRAFKSRAQAVLLDILLQEGSLVFPAVVKAYEQQAYSDYHDLLDVFDVLNTYVTIPDEYVTEVRMGGTGLVFSKEAYNLRSAILGSITVLAETSQLLKEVPHKELEPAMIQRPDGTTMRASLQKERGYIHWDEAGVIAEVIELKDDVPVGTKEYLYLGGNWRNRENGGKSLAFAIRAVNIGKYLLYLNTPNVVSAEPEDYPDATSVHPTKDPFDPEDVASGTKFMETVYVFASLVVANRHKLPPRS